MASKQRVKVVWNQSGYLELMKSAEVQAELTRQAHAVRDQLGDGYEVENGAYVGLTRANVSIANTRVVAATKEANNDNYDNNTMLKALGGKA